ncbi:sulfatase-like hydrolase/transferase [Agromyces sp. ZXT2-3]|uniref:sulfatase-like hydrolase/transferase n=1 Tax=Agromyces sp. ZXT2-3 TaxID=3461152 RepID=UPI00405508D7
MTDVLVAGYQDIESAQHDFDGLVRRVKEKTLRIEGAILVTHDPDGEVTVADTGDHLGRKGAGWGAGVGLAVGLFAPALIPAIAVGAAGGALAGVFADTRLKSGIADHIGTNLPPGRAGIVVVFDEASRLAVEQALAGSPAKSVAQTEHRGLAQLKASLAEAAGKFSPDRTVLPLRDPAFGGTAGRTIDQSVPDWTVVMTPKPPAGAPNVLVVLIDDAGFGNPSTFGGPIDTPNMTRVQQMGLTDNRFHVTAICSPTRAALLTGRNQHRVGFGSIAEYPGPFPGYTAALPKSCAPIARILKDNGYVTGGFGKWHLTPDNVQGAAGPFDRWPSGWGFDHWWGFLSGAAGQYDPIITQGNTTLGVPVRDDGQQYYFPDDITDRAVEWLHAVRAQDADAPWFMYYSTGCAHAPHHVESAWADRYSGRFDAGWDEYRKTVFARQKELGIVPQDAELTERPDLFPAWDSLSEDEKRLYVRQMEVFAGYSENADWNVGRLIDSIEEMGDLDDTLIFYIWGDNGASMEGTITGSFNELTFLNGVPLTPEQQLELIEQHGGIEELGGIDTAPHYAAAWGWAGNTPFKWGKQTGSHLGGTRNPMVVAWPDRIPGGGEMRSQFTHCIDIGPTILEAVGVPEARSVDGIAQEPMDGTSFFHTFEAADAEERHTVQYFESMGCRAIYKDGWWACARLDRVPWDFSPATIAKLAPGVYDPEQDTWELYDLTEDFTQAHDLAAERPEKLAELQELFWQEAERNKALPLLGGMSIFFGILPPLPTTTRFTFHGDVQNIQRGMIPRIYGRSYAIEGDLVVPDGGAEGVVVAMADEIGGFALWVDGDGLLHHTYSMLGVEQYRQVATSPLPTGRVTVRMQFDADEMKPGTGGVASLWANGAKIGEGRIDRTVPIAFTSYSGMDIGRDNGLVVDAAYKGKAPYAFTGTVNTVVFDLKPAPVSVEKRLHHAAGATGMGASAAG